MRIILNLENETPVCITCLATPANRVLTIDLATKFGDRKSFPLPPRYLRVKVYLRLYSLISKLKMTNDLSNILAPFGLGHVGFFRLSRLFFFFFGGGGGGVPAA